MGSIHLKNLRILELLEDLTDDEIKQTIAEAKIALKRRKIWTEMSDKEKESAWDASYKTDENAFWKSKDEEQKKWDI